MNLGQAAEALAAQFLKMNGLTLLESNFRCRFGELDLILKEGDSLVFAEVRMRTSSNFGGAAASITSAKQAKLTRTAEFYLQQTRSNAPCRFDAILMDGLSLDRIEWIKNVF